MNMVVNSLMIIIWEYISNNMKISFNIALLIFSKILNYYYTNF